MSRGSQFLGAAVGVVLFAGVASAQIGEAWVTFTKQPSMLGVDPLALSDANTQVGFGTGDLDQDGWDDVVAVRKQQASQLGKRTSVLLMNEDGVLIDRTAQYAAVSDTPGDLGFLTPRNTRKCALGDVNLDGWLEVVTANNLSDGDAKNISHPGVYVNLAADGSGAWLGLRLENARTPQLLTVGGLAVAPRFASVALGDLTGDGAPEAYFVDYDSTETGIAEPAAWDLNDRMLVNDGGGFFTDGSAAAFTAEQLKSAFGVDVGALDANVDGALDIVKLTTLSNPSALRPLYNDPASLGDFTASGLLDFASNAPYGFDIGNLNHDGFPDVAIADDSNDKFRLGESFDGLNHVVWGPLKNYTFVTGSDDGFGQNVYLRDLDGNGWNDVLITDVDAELLGCTRRLHIYHNLGSVPGDMNLVLQEESELATGGTGAGWKGVVGMSAADAKGSYGLAFGDFDRDGDLDFLLGTCNGTKVFRNETIGETCAQDLGFGDPGVVLSLCGADFMQPGSHAVLALEGAAPLSPLFVVGSLTSAPTPFKGGTLVPIPPMLVLQGLLTDAVGGFTLDVPGGSGAPVHVFVQCVVLDAGQYQLSNAVDAFIGT
jgi:hypothetical protein